MYSSTKMLRLLNAFTSHAMLSNSNIIIYWFASTGSSLFSFSFSFSLFFLENKLRRCYFVDNDDTAFCINLSRQEYLLRVRFFSACHSMRACVLVQTFLLLLLLSFFFFFSSKGETSSSENDKKQFSVTCFILLCVVDDATAVNNR